jgi:3-oxoadipate enol-lactonase
MTASVPPFLPPGHIVEVEGRGEFFVRHHRHEDPEAPTLLLSHGWTASADLQFMTAYEALAERWSFVALDHRGHGRGLRPPVPFELEDCADDAAGVLRALGIACATAVGYSMGGPIVLHLARRHPELIEGLVLQATALEWRATRRERMQWRGLRPMGWVMRSFAYPRWLDKGVARLVHTDHELAPYRSWMLGEMRRNDPWMMIEAGKALSRYDARGFASSLGCSAAVVVTTKDRLVRPRKQRQLAVALGATDRVIELPGDHLVPWEDPGAFAEATVAAVDSVVSLRPAVGSASDGDDRESAVSSNAAPSA